MLNKDKELINELLEKYSKEEISNVINEISINAKVRNTNNAIKSIKNNYKGIRTFAIISPENPNALQLSKKDNKSMRRDFAKHLKDGNYIFVKQEGIFDNRETSYFVFNINLETAKRFAFLYGQYSFIFATLGEDEVISEYWEKENPNLPISKRNDYVKKDETSGYIDASNFTNYYSIIGKKFKYRFPFKTLESLNKCVFNTMSELNEEEVEKVLENAREFIGQSGWLYRGKIYSKINESFFSK